MAEFTGTISPGDINEVYSRTAIDLGTRIKDTDGNEYIFLKGVASTVVGSWVTYDEAFDTTLLVTTAKGPIAVAQAAIIAGKKGWYGIWGTVIGKGYAAYTTIADNLAVLGRSGADGSVGAAPTAGDIIYGVICRSAMDEASSNATTTFQIYYPWVDGGTAGH